MERVVRARSLTGARAGPCCALSLRAVKETSDGRTGWLHADMCPRGVIACLVLSLQFQKLRRRIA